jgi:hypothetical protein
MQELATRKAYFTSASHILLSFMIAPLFTISTSMQLSIPYNAVTINEFRKTETGSRAF